MCHALAMTSRSHGWLHLAGDDESSELPTVLEWGDAFPTETALPHFWETWKGNSDVGLHVTAPAAPSNTVISTFLSPFFCYHFRFKMLPDDRFYSWNTPNLISTGTPFQISRILCRLGRETPLPDLSAFNTFGVSISEPTSPRSLVRVLPLLFSTI